MRPKRIHLSLTAGAILLAGATFVFHGTNVVHNYSASLDLGWYVRVPWASLEKGAIVMFPIPDRVQELAERGGMNTRIPLMKRIESVKPGGGLVVRGDCGGDRSLDSRYFGELDRDQVIGVFTPIPGLTSPCEELFSSE